MNENSTKNAFGEEIEEAKFVDRGFTPSLENLGNINRLWCWFGKAFRKIFILESTGGFI